MSDIDHPRELLRMARSDIDALTGILELKNQGKDYFSDEIFGFHAQQAAEKILKAKIAMRGELYSKTDDLMSLVERLERLGEDVTGLADLVDLNSFAVQYRYESLDTDDDEIDRPELLKTLKLLYNTTESAIG
jgi:HEPN domain-containing protein